jgi:hypothetical protein
MNVIFLVGIQGRVGQQVGVSQNRLQRDAQFVADVGQKLAFGVIGANGFVPLVLGAGRALA